MSRAIAERALDRFIAGLADGDAAHVSFLGGEPLLNRPVLRHATRYASELAARRGIRLGFSTTTNATLVRADDAAFFAQHGFAVTVSIDGDADTHDRLRPTRTGRGSHDALQSGVELLGQQPDLRLCARVTVTPHNLDLRRTLDALVELGFDDIGFSPMLASPSRRDQLEEGDLTRLTDEMIAVGRDYVGAVLAGRPHPCTNIATALREIHRGAQRRRGCGAGTTYMSVDADGDIAACHRFVADPLGSLGDLDQGVDPAARSRWIASTDVDGIEPCRSCWARYLCGGGCHHEVAHRGRPACDHIRTWLEFCLAAYVEISTGRPEYFDVAT